MKLRSSAQQRWTGLFVVTFACLYGCGSGLGNGGSDTAVVSDASGGGPSDVGPNDSGPAAQDVLVADASQLDAPEVDVSGADLASGDTQPSDTLPSDVLPFDAQPVDAVAVDGQSGDVQSVDASDSGTLPNLCATAADCDDNNPCTTDLCAEQGNLILECAHTNPQLPCDDGDPCTVNDTCALGACTQHDLLVCDDGDPCTDDLCDKGSGGCTAKKKTTCIDVKAPCLADTDCKIGLCDLDTHACVPCLKGADCGPHAACLMKQCKAYTACTANSDCPQTAPICDTTFGNCVGCKVDSDCGMGEVCAFDTCKPTPQACSLASPCPAGLVCTPDGTCGACNTDADCWGGGYCSVNHTCVPGLCADGDAACLNQGQIHLACAPNHASYVVENCFAVQIGQCQKAACDATSGCGTAFSPGPCDDGVACSSNDTCTPSGCAGTTNDAGCDDGGPCTVDTCIATGCTHTPSSALCDDGAACTSDTCGLDGQCIHLANDGACDDGDPCTTDSCDGAQGSLPSGCTILQNTAACDDGNACTVGDVCQPGYGCVSGSIKVCNDGKPCTTDQCDPVSGACSASIQSSCLAPLAPCFSSGDCTKGFCDPAMNACVGCLQNADCGIGGLCLGQNCVYGDLCDTDAACKDPAKSHCNKAALGGACVGCTDSIQCPYQQSCVSGGCVPNAVDVSCTKTADCPGGVCDGGLCVECAVDSDCPANAYCAGDHVCHPGICATGTLACQVSNASILQCNPHHSGYELIACGLQPHDQCETMTCSDSAGCFAQPAPGIVCDDGNACTGSDTCGPSGCAGKPLVGLCDDNQPCTLDTCLTGGGCTHTPQDSACADGLACTTDKCDATVGCLHLPPDESCAAQQPTATCTGTKVWSDDAALPAVLLGRTWTKTLATAAAGDGAVVTVVNHFQLDNKWYYQFYVSSVATPGGWAKPRDDLGQALDVEVVGTSIAVLVLAADGSVHVAQYDVSQLDKPLYQPTMLTLTGTAGACGLQTGTLRAAPGGGFWVAVAGATCAAQPWLGVGATGGALVALPVNAQLFPQSVNALLVGLFVADQSLIVASGTELRVVAYPLYANGAVINGQAPVVYPVDLPTMAAAKTAPWKLPLTLSSDILSLAAVGPDGQLALLLQSPGGGVPIQQLWVGSGPAAAAMLAPGGAAPVSFGKTSFSSAAEAPVLGAWAWWTGKDLLSTSVPFANVPVTGANVLWLNSAGKLRGQASGASAIAQGTTFTSVGGTPRFADSADGCFFVSGAVANTAKPATVQSYRVCCLP